MAHVSNGTIISESVENKEVLNRSSSEPELGIVLKSCTNLSQHGANRRVDSRSSLSSHSSEEFRQRSATHGGATTSMKKFAMLRKQRIARR